MASCILERSTDLKVYKAIIISRQIPVMDMEFPIRFKNKWIKGGNNQTMHKP